MPVVKCSLVALVLLALACHTAAQGLFNTNANGGLFGSGSQGEVDFSSGDNAGIYPGENNGYLPPPNREGEPSNDNPALLLPPGDDKPDNSGRDDQPTNNTPNTAFPPAIQPQVGCAAALICVEEQFCTMTGVISKTAIKLSEDQKLRRVPMVDCRNPDNGVVGKCCRDPDYVDPWPAGGSLPPNYKGGFDERGFPIYLQLTGKDLNELAHPNKPVQSLGPKKTFTSVKPIRPQVIVQQPDTLTGPFQSQPTFGESKIVPGKPELIGSIQQPAFIQPEQPKQNFIIPEHSEKTFVPQQPSQSFIPHQSESHQFQEPIKNFGTFPEYPVFGQKLPKQPTLQIVDEQEPIQPSQTFIHHQPKPSQVIVQQPQQPSQIFVQQPEQQSHVIVEHPQQPPHTLVEQPQQSSQVLTQHPDQPSQVFVQQPEQPSQVFVQQPEQPSQVFVQQPEQPSQVFVQQPEQPSQVFDQQPEQPSQVFVQQPEQPSQVFVQQPEQPSQVFVQQPEQPSQVFVQQPEQPSQVFVQQPEQPSQVFVQHPEQSSETFGVKITHPQQTIQTFVPQQPSGFVSQSIEVPEKSKVIVPEVVIPEQPEPYQPEGYQTQHTAGFKVVIPEQPEIIQQSEQPKQSIQQEIPFGQPAPGQGVENVKQFQLPQFTAPQSLPNAPNQFSSIPNQISNFFNRPQQPVSQDTEIVNAPADVPDVPLAMNTKKPFFQNFFQGIIGGKTVDTPTLETAYIAPHIPGAQCGIINKVQRPSSLLDVETAFGEIPWEAMVLHNIEKKLLCSGVFIAPNAVLTAAHCVYGVNPSEVSVKAGEWRLGYELKHEEPLPFEIVQVQSIISHPKYQVDAAGYDTAILLLQKSVRLDQHVDTICVPQQAVTLANKKCISVGWGKANLQLHLAGSKMNKIEVDVLNNNLCSHRLQYAESPLNLDDSLVCVKAHAQNNNMCQVDIGGPLACDRGDGIYELVGVYSQDTGCQPTNQVATFALIDYKWVNEMLSTPVTQFSQVPEQPQQTPSKFHYHSQQPHVPCDCQKGTQPAGSNQYLPPY